MNDLEPWDTGQSVQVNPSLALVDLLDRVLGAGVVIAGEVTLAIEGVDVAHISLRALVGSVSALVGSDE